MRTKRNGTAALVLGLGLLLPTLAISGIATVKQFPAAPRAAAPAPWRAEIAAVDAALGKGDVRAALSAWQAAHAVALQTRRWEALIDAGDARVRIDRAAGVDRGGRAEARSLYLSALFRARADGSVEGVERAAFAFDALGDREVAAQAMRMAAGLAPRLRAN